MGVFEDGLEAGVFFYSDPENIDFDGIDPLMRGIVEDVNRSGWLWTAESCQGHPDDDTGMAWAGNTSPMLRLACKRTDVGHLFGALFDASASVESALCEGEKSTFVWQVHPEERRNDWVEILLYVKATTVFQRDLGIEMLRKFAELVAF